MPPLCAPVVPPGNMSAHDQPTLSGVEVVLRPFTRTTDVQTLVSAYSEPSIRQWHVTSLTDSEAEQWIDSRHQHWRSETGADWAVTRGPTTVGRVGLKSINLEEGIAELAYWILAEHRRNGYATSAVLVLTDWAFKDLGLQRLELIHSVHNAPSCRVAERVGYQLEGTKRHAGLHRDGWHDMHLHAQISSDTATNLAPRTIACTDPDRQD
jgi:RimJ/RimL family protein N-acetyltransferase